MTFFGSVEIILRTFHIFVRIVKIYYNEFESALLTNFIRARPTSSFYAECLICQDNRNAELVRHALKHPQELSESLLPFGELTAARVIRSEQRGHLKASGSFFLSRVLLILYFRLRRKAREWGKQERWERAEVQ